MDQALRDILSMMSTSLPAVLGAVAGAILLVAVVVLARHWQIRRQYRQWLDHRLFVPKRPASSREPVRSPVHRERRCHARRAGNPVAVVVYDETDTHPIGEGRVIDRSLGGVCIATSLRLEVGAKVQIRPLTQRHQMPGVAVEIRNVRPAPAAWRLGCQFQRRPSWSVLMHLR